MRHHHIQLPSRLSIRLFYLALHRDPGVVIFAVDRNGTVDAYECIKCGEAMYSYALCQACRWHYHPPEPLPILTP